jgi:hypothetical protein
MIGPYGAEIRARRVPVRWCRARRLEMTDPNGVNPKDRPSVVVTPTDEIDPEGPIVVVAISTLLPGPAPDDCV